MAEPPSPTSRAGRWTEETVAAVPASTVLLVRDPPGGEGGGLEVLMLERHLDSDFAGGALVFPGGKVAAEDRELPDERWDGPNLDGWCTALGVSDAADALGLLVAAVRETYEEVGILLARREDGTWPTLQDLRSPTFQQARHRLAARDEHWDWRPWLAEERLVLDLQALALWSWWVTPVGQHKRFDTRFFIATTPEDQVAEHDAVEATEVVWCRPAEALAAHERREAVVIFPTRRNLEALAPYATARHAVDAARRGEVDRRRILPTVVRDGDRVMVQHPDDEHPSPL